MKGRRRLLSSRVPRCSCPPPAASATWESGLAGARGGGETGRGGRCAPVRPETTSRKRLPAGGCLRPTGVCWEDGDTLGARAWRASQGEGVPTPSPVTHTETERLNSVAFPCHSSSLRQAQLRAGVINEPLATPGRVTQAGDGAAGGAPPSARHPARAGVAALASAVETAGPRERPA